MSSTCPEWQEHSLDTPVLNANAARLDHDLLDNVGHRQPFKLELPLAWHRALHQSCTHTPANIIKLYVGGFRGTNPPHCLAVYDVSFGPHRGVLPTQVAAELQALEAHLTISLSSHDSVLTTQEKVTASRIDPLLETAAYVYSEWLRIHPFADGNGRTSRLLVNWMMSRYWLPLILSGRPPYNKEALVSATDDAIISGNLRPLKAEFRRRLTKALRAP